jgi:type IV pilus assembly protein PilA
MVIKKYNKKKKGFTLVELIIVLAIIAIIAAIAIPNFTKIRENSKIKADKQSEEMLKRITMVLLTDESVKLDGTNGATIKLTFDKEKTNNEENKSGLKVDPKGLKFNGDTTGEGNSKVGRNQILEDAFKEVQRPQQNNKDGFEITISKDSEVTKVETISTESK